MPVERFEETREAAAPIETCWNVLTDPSRGAEWLTFADEVQADGAPQLGQQLTAKGSLLGIPLHARSEVHRFEPLAAYGWTGQEPFPTSVVIELEAIDEATTRFTTRLEAEPGRFFPVGKRLALRTIRGQFARSADQLIELVEAEARD
jgi:uncharacterized protein YndB with AHSA1/START domain